MKVKVIFDNVADMRLELNPYEKLAMEASDIDGSWEIFAEEIADKAAMHFMKWFVIEDVEVINE